MSAQVIRTLSRFFMISVFLLSISACSGSKEEAANRYLNSGIELYSEGELSKANVELRNALQIDPKLASAYYYLGLIAETQQNWKALYKNLSKVEQLDPNHVQAKIKIAYLLLLAKQADGALEKADFILALDPNNAEAYAIKASAYLQKDLYDVAMEYIDKAMAQNSQSAEIASIKVSILHKQGDTEGALAMLSDWIEREDDDLHLLLLRTEINQEINDVVAMEADYRTLIKTNRDEKAFYLKLAKLLNDSQRIEAAAKVLEDYLRRNSSDTQVRMVIVDLLSGKDLMAGDELLDHYIARDPQNAELRFFRIDRLMAKGSNAGVLAELENIISSDFEDQHLFRAKAFKAGMQLSAGEHEKALQLANEILSVDRHFEQALLVRARYHLLAEDIDAVVSDLRTVLRNNPESEPALVMLANASLSSDSGQLADDTFRKVLDINPGNVQAAVPVIQSLLEKRDVDRSERLIKDALLRSPDNDILLSILAQIKLSKQDFVGSQKIVSRIDKIGRNPAFSHYLSGRSMQAQGDYKTALNEYQQALAINPDLGRALEGLTTSYLRLSQEAKLLEYLKQFRSKNPSNMMALSIMASVYSKRGDRSTAQDLLEQGLEQDANWVNGYTALAYNQRAAGDPQAAVDSLERGLKALPDSSLLKILLASAHEKLSNKDRAVELYEDVLKSNPDHQAVINNLASLLTDEYASAENINRTVKLTERFADSEQPYFVDTYAWALINADLPEVAEPLLAKVIEVAPTVAVFHYHRGVGLSRLGREDEAKASLQQARDLASSDAALQMQISEALSEL